MSKKHKKNSGNLSCLKEASKKILPENVVDDLANRYNNAIYDFNTISCNLVVKIFHKTKGWFKK